MSTRVYIQDVQVYREDDTSVVWVDHSGEGSLPSPGGGTRDAALLVQLGVDGTMTIIHAQGGDRVVIAKAIEDLTFLLGHLDDMYPADQPRGRCLAHGDWGRCYSEDGHAEDHHFPTERDWERANNIPTAPGLPT